MTFKSKNLLENSNNTEIMTHSEEAEKKKQLILENTLLKPCDVSKILGITIETLAVWRCTNRTSLKFYRIGRSIRYRLSEVNEFISSRQYKHNSLKID